MNSSRDLAREYSAKAAAYAKSWGPVIHPMGLPLLHELPLASARKVIDIGAGTGALLRELAAAAPQAYLVGVDCSRGMLRIARHGTDLPLAVMDAERLALQAESFDVASLVFMLFHLADPPAGLMEVRRILRRGGAIGVVTWGMDLGTPGNAIWTEELDNCGAAPDPRDPSVMKHDWMDTTGKLAGLLEGAGFTSLRVWAQSFQHHWTVEDLLAMQIGCGMPGRRWMTLPDDAKVTCRSRVEARLRLLTPEERVYGPEVLFAIARRP